MDEAVSTAPQNSLTLDRIQKLVGELTSAYEDLIGGETIAAPAQIRVAVADWSSEVLPSIDNRIVKCHELVKRGLRDEALGYATEQPDLFEAVKLLDLERFGRTKYVEWMEASQAAGLQLPLPPQLDKVGDIEAARDRVAELRPLLERWRRLNIQRASLPQRIEMLHELLRRDTDHNNQVWQEMLAEHEKHRITEIKACISRLGEQCARDREVDVAAVESDTKRFLAELQGEWRTLRPPKSISEQATLLFAQVRQRRIDAVLDGVTGLFESAHARLNTDRPAAREQLSRHLDTWNQTLTERGVIDPADPRLTRVQSIVEYAERFREHDSLVAEVSQQVAERPASLGSRISWSEALDRMMDRIDETASRLPSDDINPERIGELSDRVARIAESVRREIMIRQIASVTAIAAVVLVGCVAAWTVYSVRQHRAGVESAIADCVEAVKTIEGGGAPDANIGDAWREPVRSDPEVARAVERVAAARQAQDSRKAAFVSRRAEIQNAIVELQNAIRTDPLTPWPQAFTRAIGLMVDIRKQKLAFSDEERAMLEPPAAMIRAKDKEFSDAANDAFEDRARRLEADLASVEIVMADDLDKAAPMIEQAGAELERLRLIAGTAACPAAEEDYGRKKLVSTAVSALVAAESQVASKVNTLRTRRTVIAGLADREKKADRLLADGNHAEYADSIREIAKDIGPGPIARDYGAVADNHAAWQAIADWSRFVAALGNPAEFTAEEAKAGLEKLQGLGPEAIRLPDAASARGWLEPELKRMQTRTSENLKILREELNRRLDGTYGETLDGVIVDKEVSDYPRYYCLLKDRPLPDAKKRVSYVTGLPDSRKQWPTKQLSFDPEKYTIKNSPQKRLAVECKKIVGREVASAANEIDELAVDVIKACASASNPPAGELSLDPCLHAVLLRFLLEQACKECPALAECFTSTLAIINSGNTPNGTPIIIKGVDNEAFVAAIDPEKQNADAWVQVQRGKCADFVKSVANEADATDRTLADRTNDITSKWRELRQYRYVGRLRKLPGGSWTISGGTASDRAGRQLLIAGGVRDGFVLLPCVTCDDKGAIPAGTDVKANAGEPLYIEIRKDRKG